ncbi:MAG: PEP-CTERM sorting domain-containing protein, partial [Akkermansia sp.]|nr:PEP-CTERM sorting domain-containing protein [Akkermansia sp.]
NGSVTFSGNKATSTGELASACGGAICGDEASITLSNNGSVTFSGNTAESASSSSYAACGGAIYGDEASITLSNNGSVTFSGNAVSSSSYAYGGAIYGDRDSTITLSNNGSVSFIGNTASGSSLAYGGAIYGGDDSTITLNNNGDVIFSGNTASGSSYSAFGGAIYATGNLSIRNNESVLFEKNVEKSGSSYRLRSIDARGSGDEISLSAAAGKSIEFRDSVYIAGSTLNLNKDYGGIAQTGDIIFTGKYTETHLNDILAADGAGRRASADEVLQSRISNVNLITELHAGRLIVEDNAVYMGDGITVHDGASVQVRDAAFLHNGTYKSSSYNLTFNSGSTLGCSGSSIISGQVQMQEGSVLSFDCSDGACETTISGSLSIEGALSVTVDAGRSSLAENTVLMYVSNEVVGWDSANITLVGEDGGTLTWVDNSLVLNYNPDTYRYYYDSGYAWYNERVVGAVCMHHRVDACFYYSSLSSGGGAAIYAPFVLLNHNRGVLLKDNTVSDMPEAYGGAIYGSNADFYVDLSHNDKVSFERNFAYSSRAGNTRGKGGAIYSNINGTVRLVGNKKVEFYENAVSSNSDVYGEASGAAIYGGGINIDHNDEVLFTRNNVFGHREDLGYGGAILSEICGVLSICNNQKVRFEGNSVSAWRAYGGAVAVFNMFSLNDNDIVEFARNKAAARKSEQGAFGGAIYTYNDLSIRNNDSVEFYQNAEVVNGSYRLRSIYADDYGDVSLSAAAGKSITFRDSIYIGEGSSFKLNEAYEGKAQLGDIIFTGATTVDDLYTVKDNVAGTTEEIRLSRTTEVNALTELYGGRLRVEEGAIYQGRGITAMEGSAATVRVQNATLSHDGFALTFNAGTTLQVQGESLIVGDVLMMAQSVLNLERETTINGALTLGLGMQLAGNILAEVQNLQLGESLTLVSGLESLAVQTQNLMRSVEYTTVLDGYEVQASEYFSNLAGNTGLVMRYDGEAGTVSITQTMAVPEPATATLGLLALAALAVRRRRK